MAQKKDVKKANQHSTVPAHRKNFKEYILANPNYFGTLPKFGGKVGKALSGDTTYEQLECLGLNPTSSRLEGVINIKQHSGYGTDGCGVGTVEYVRYFVQDGSGWHDLGLDTVQVYNLAGPLPLSYSTSVNFSAAWVCTAALGLPDWVCHRRTKASPKPCSAPQITKFQLAPCHNPPITMVITRFT